MYFLIFFEFFSTNRQMVAFIPKRYFVWETPPSKDCRARTEEGRAAQRRRPTGISGRRRGLKSGAGGAGADGGRFLCRRGKVFLQLMKKCKILEVLCDCLRAHGHKTGGARQNDGGYSNDIFPRFFRQRDVRKFGPCQSAPDGGGAPK